MKQYNIITDVLGLCQLRSYKELDGEKGTINLETVYTILEQGLLTRMTFIFFFFASIHMILRRSRSSY